MDREWYRLARSAAYRPVSLAATAGVSLRTLQRHFKSRYGITVSDWLKKVRMQEAAHRVRAGDRVKEIAIDLGYKQLSHFSREFKRKYGASPTRLPAAEEGPDRPGVPGSKQ